MNSVLFSKIVNMDELCQDFLGADLKDLIGVSDDGTEIKITVSSQVLFKHGMYYHSGYFDSDVDLDEEDNVTQASINRFFKLLDYLKIDRGSYSEEIRKLIAERCLEKIEIGDSPYDDDIIIVDDYVYVDQQAVLRIVSGNVRRKDIIIKAMPLNDDWILEEILL